MTSADIEWSETMSNSPNGDFPVLFILAALFAIVPWIVYGADWEVLFGFVCGAVSAKWFLFGVLDWVGYR